MAGTAYLRYSNRTVTKRAGGRYDLAEMWIVPNIESVGGGDDEPSIAWQAEALTAENLPAIGDLNQDGGFVCVSLTPRSLDSQGMAYVDARYVEDPLTLPTEVHYFSMSKVKPAWHGFRVQYGGPAGVASPEEPPDIFAGDEIVPVRNSAGDRYNPPVTYEAPLERIEVMLHVSLDWHDNLDWSRYLKHYNATPFVVMQYDPDNPGNTTARTFPAGTLMFSDKRAPLVKEPFFHRLVTCTFLYDPDMWCLRVPDMGPRARNDDDKLTAVKDALGRYFSGIAELDGEGHQLLPDGEGHMPPAVMYQWWPVPSDRLDVLSAEFDDLDLFTPERELAIESDAENDPFE